MAKIRNPCKGELEALARTLKHFRDIIGCEDEQSLRRIIGYPCYEQLSQDGKYPFRIIKGSCAVKMARSVNHQEGDIGWKLRLLGYEKPEDLPKMERRDLAVSCLAA